MSPFKDPATMLGNVLGEFKSWYTRVSPSSLSSSQQQQQQDCDRRLKNITLPSLSSSSPSLSSSSLVTCDKFPKYRAIIELTGRVMRENTGTWSNSVKRNIEVALCVTGLETGECYFMLLDDPLWAWVWNAVKQLSSSLLPSVRRLVISLLYRFERHPDVVPLMMWVLRKDDDFICRYYVALSITKSPAIASRIDERVRGQIVSLVFQEEYKKINLHDQDDIQRKLNIVFTRSMYPVENMLVENAKVNRGD